MRTQDGIIETKAYARAGLIGNPSDGFGGKTISFAFKDYSATVSLWPSPKFRIVPGSDDVDEFSSDSDFLGYIRQHGYYAGARLIKAAIKVFHDYCEESGICLSDRRYSISYSTDIPRQNGLAGSSAIVTAAIRALSEFHGFSIPLDKQPNVILRAEKGELSIAAGLQDRVAQAYEGLVYMDFSDVKDTLTDQGRYERMDPSSLPPIFIAYLNEQGGKDSGKVHNNVTERFNMGDPVVVDAMKRFAALAYMAKGVIEGSDTGSKWSDLGSIMQEAWNLRSSIYKIRGCDRRMIEIAEGVGAYAQFAGSGGAIVGTFKDNEMFDALISELEKNDVSVIRPRITEGSR